MHFCFSRQMYIATVEGGLKSGCLCYSLVENSVSEGRNRLKVLSQQCSVFGWLVDFFSLHFLCLWFSVENIEFSVIINEKSNTKVT